MRSPASWLLTPTDVEVECPIDSGPASHRGVRIGIADVGLRKDHVRRELRQTGGGLRGDVPTGALRIHAGLPARGRVDGYVPPMRMMIGPLSPVLNSCHFNESITIPMTKSTFCDNGNERKKRPRRRRPNS